MLCNHKHLLKHLYGFAIVADMYGMEIQLELFAFLDKFYLPDADERPCRLQVPSGFTTRSGI